VQGKKNADGSKGYNKRSHFFGVRRTFNHNQGKFEYFFAECHKPGEIKGSSRKIQIWGFKTDVEAAELRKLVITRAAYSPSSSSSSLIIIRTAE